MSFVFPANVFDEPDKLLSSIGSFWANVYQGSFPVRSILHSRAQLDAQNHLDLLHLLASMSRYTVPIFRTENWFLLQLKESEKNQTTADLAKFDSTYTFNGEINWGNPIAQQDFTWPAPAGLSKAKIVMNRVTGASVTLAHGVDFILDPVTQTISFRADPFANSLISIRDVVEDNLQVDREAALWLYSGEFDLENVYTQFGYALGIHLKSSEGYRDLVNAIFDALVDGGTQKSVDSLVAAVAGVPLVRSSDEVVQDILLDSSYLWIITDKEAYRHHKFSTPTVAVGDVLLQGQALTDTLQVFEFGSGQVPDALRSLTVPAGHLAAGYYAGVSFENKLVPLQVEEDVDGYTKVSFEVGGFPGDTIMLWEETHAKGVAAGQTLAMLMDQRPESARDTQPTAMALPTNINPLGFLLQNVFRNNLYVVMLKPETFGDTALRLHNAKALRKIVPPHTAIIIVVELAVSDDPVILDAPGDSTEPGAEERLLAFSGTTYSESLDPSVNISESVRVRQLAGRCV